MCDCCGSGKSYTEVYTVKGMSCHHCVMRVEKAIRSIPEVDDVKVDLESGKATVTSRAPLSKERVSEVVKEAGYEVV